MSEQLDRYTPSELDDEVEVCLAFEVASLEAELEAMKRIGDAGREVYNDWMSGKDADELTASWPAMDELHEALAAAQEKE